MQIVLFTHVQSLIEHCSALADGVGVTLEVRSPDSGGWQNAVLILVGEDVTHAPATPGIPSVLVGAEGAGDDVWRAAARLGVDNVVVLPAGAEWLSQRMIQAVEPPREPALTHGVIGGTGGAGASVLACAVARQSAESGVSTVLVDADALGGGLDVVLGCENIEGLRWPALASSRGRLRPSTLQDALPRQGNLSVLSWDRTLDEDTSKITEGVFDAVIAASQQAFDFVVIDLPRHAPIEWAATCHSMTVVTPGRVRAAVATAAVASRLTQVHSSIRVAVRESGRGGVDAELLAKAVGVDLAGTFRDDVALGEKLDRGEGLPRGRTHLAKFASYLFDDVFAEER